MSRIAIRLARGSECKVRQEIEARERGPCRRMAEVRVEGRPNSDLHIAHPPLGFLSRRLTLEDVVEVAQGLGTYFRKLPSLGGGVSFVCKRGTLKPERAGFRALEAEGPWLPVGPFSASAFFPVGKVSHIIG